LAGVWFETEEKLEFSEIGVAAGFGESVNEHEELPQEVLPEEGGDGNRGKRLAAGVLASIDSSREKSRSRVNLLDSVRFLFGEKNIDDELTSCWLLTIAVAARKIQMSRGGSPPSVFFISGKRQCFPALARHVEMSV
jgi:hypothetical protein